METLKPPGSATVPQMLMPHVSLKQLLMSLLKIPSVIVHQRSPPTDPVQFTHLLTVYQDNGHH